MPTPIINKAIKIIEIAPYDVILIKILKSLCRQTKIIMKNMMKEVQVCEKVWNVIASVSTGRSTFPIHLKRAKIIGYNI